MRSRTRIIVINEKDNVATALDELPAGTTVSVKTEHRMEKIELISHIPRGHKFALTHIDRGGAVIKYGETIGKSTEEIPRGQHVHVHNVVSQSKGETK
jgi:altronate dehydratase small subunit